MFLLGGIHYMNALYQNQQNLAYREVLSWAAFLILTMVSPAVLFSKGRTAALIGLIAGGIWYVVQSLTQKEALQTNELLGKQIFSGRADRLFLRSDSGRAGGRIRAKKAGRGQCQPRLYGSAVWIYGAFGDFQKYAPLADLSGGRICTLLCFLSGLEQKETPVE